MVGMVPGLNRNQQQEIYEAFDESAIPKVAPPHEVSMQLAISRIDAMNNKLLRERQELYMLNLASDTDYKTYIVSDE